jgi:hypothetical protein
VSRLSLETVEDGVRRYITGVARQDKAMLAALFAPTAHITGIDEGKPISVPRDRWIEVVCAPDKAGAGAPDYRISSVTIMDTVACAFVETLYGGFRYCDALTFVAAGSDIQVSGKTFHQYPKAA